MSEPTLDDLRVKCRTPGGSSFHRCVDGWERLTPAEFDRIATEWLREKLGISDMDVFRRHADTFRAADGRPFRDDGPEELWELATRLVDVLDGGQEDTDV